MLAEGPEPSDHHGRIGVVPGGAWRKKSRRNLVAMRPAPYHGSPLHRVDTALNRPENSPAFTTIVSELIQRERGSGQQCPRQPLTDEPRGVKMRAHQRLARDPQPH